MPDETTVEAGTPVKQVRKPGAANVAKQLRKCVDHFNALLDRAAELELSSSVAFSEDEQRLSVEYIRFEKNL